MSIKQAAEDLRKVLDENKMTMTVTTEEGTVTVEPRTGAKGATDREGDLDVVVGQKAVKVTTVYIPALDTAGE